MYLNKKNYLRFLVFLVLCVFVSVPSVSAQSLGTSTEPPRLRDLEPIVVQLIYVVWGLGTFLLTLVLMLRGVQYMLSMGAPEKQQEIRQSSTNWLYSLLVFFLAYPVILGVYNVTGIGGSSSSCYEDISTPGFRFFFPTVCTDPQAGSDKYSVGASCDGFGNDELAIVDDRGYCCRNFVSSNIVIPVGEWIKLAGNPTIAQKYSPSSTAQCAGSPSTCTIGDPDCDPTYEIRYDSGAYIVVDYVKPSVCSKYPSSLACKICTEGIYDSASQSYKLSGQSYKVEDCYKGTPISGYN